MATFYIRGRCEQLENFPVLTNMDYVEFRNILNPALEILNRQSQDFKDKFGDAPFIIKPTSREFISAFEKRLDIKIPQFYKEFIVEFNPHGLEIMFHSLNGLEEIEGTLDFLRSHKVLNRDFVPISSDNSGNYYCVKENNDLIYFLDHERFFDIGNTQTIEDYFQNLVNEKISDSN